MFDLEQAIAEWRKQMLAAGIKTPVPLEELESHLREEIKQQIKSGMNEVEAFNSAVQEIGQPDLLKIEFKKTAGLYDFLAKRRNLKFTLSVNRVLGLVWLAWCGPFFVGLCIEMMTKHEFDAKAWITFFVVLSAVIGSVLLTCDSKLGRIIVRMNALFWLVAPLLIYCLIDYVVRHSHGIDSTRPEVSLWDLVAEHGMVFAFWLVSILILHLPEKANLRATVKL
jgi:membrane-associated HD superfamily phosphohydrolase